MLPALGNEFIVLLKETSVAGYIGIADLTKGAQSVGSVTYNYIVPPALRGVYLFPDDYRALHRAEYSGKADA